MLMLESSVTFFPLFLGALTRKRSPTLDQP